MPVARTDSRTASCPSSWAPRKGCRTIPSIQPKTVVVVAIPRARVSAATVSLARVPAARLLRRARHVCLSRGPLRRGAAGASHAVRHCARVRNSRRAAQAGSALIGRAQSGRAARAIAVLRLRIILFGGFLLPCVGDPIHRCRATDPCRVRCSSASTRTKSQILCPWLRPESPLLLGSRRS